MNQTGFFVKMSLNQRLPIFFRPPLIAFKCTFYR